MTAVSALLQAGVLALLFFGVLAFGGVENWASSALTLGAAVLLLLLLWRKARSGPLRFPSLASPLGAFLALFFLLVLFQLLPLPPVLAGLFRPDSPASPIVGGKETGSRWIAVSLRPASTLAELLRLLACLAMFLTVAEMDEDDGKTLAAYFRLVLALTLFGFVLSLFGIIQKFSWSGQLYWLRKVSDPRAHPFGPFVNRNHFAGFIAMVIPLALSLFLSDRLHGGHRRRSPSGFDPVQALLGFMILVMILALFLTLSRAGILSFLAALGVFALLCRRFRLARRRALALSVLFLLFFFLASFTYFGWDPLLERLHPEGKVTPHRIRVWGDALRIVRDYPLLGTGLNTFAAVYPFYKSFSVRYAYPFAENDFLQLAVETGLIGLAVALGIIAVFHRPLFSLDPSQIPGRRSGRRRPSLLPGPISRRFLVAGSYAAVAALLIHSLVDFNLHIPANAFLFSTVAAIAWRTARGLGRGGEEEGGGAAADGERTRARVK